MDLQLAAVVLLLAAGSDFVGTANCPEPVVGHIVGNSLDVNNPVPFVDGHPEVQVPRVNARSQPSYPTYPAGIDKVRATVVVAGTIDIDGNVRDVKTIGCSVSKGKTRLEGDEKLKYCPQFSLHAESAFSRWRYDPALRDGTPVCVETLAKFSFQPK